MDEHEISPVGHESFPFEVSVLNHFTSQRTLANAPLCRKKRAKNKKQKIKPRERLKKTLLLSEIERYPNENRLL